MLDSQVFFLTVERECSILKDLNISLLLDFYGNLLPEKQLDMMEQYYGEDLSLSEIAHNSGITRQGVHDNIKRAATELKQFEEKLGLISRFSDITDAANKIKKLLSRDMNPESVLYKEVLQLLDAIIDEA